MHALKPFLIGILFAWAIRYAKLHRFNVISGLALRKDFTVAKALLLAVGLGAILVNLEVALGLASYHIKPFNLGGVVLGGLLFGIGMAVLGYCPGTLVISLGDGAIDAFIGVIGGLTAGASYTLVLPYIKGILGPALGKLALSSLLTTPFLLLPLVFALGLSLVWLAFWLHRMDVSKGSQWLMAGAGLALLNSLTFLKFVSNRPIGASTAYPYLSDLLMKLTATPYFKAIAKPGRWEVYFLLGALISSLLLALITKEFKPALIHDNWRKHKGNLPWKRAVWAFIGGFILIFGARMAGGCTSGHILSGGMQLAFSSLTFAVVVFSSFMLVGAMFYGKAEGEKP